MRRRLLSSKPVLAVASAAGTAARWATTAGRTVPGVAGVAAGVYGLSQIYAPLGWLALSAALLLIDRRMTS